MKFRKKNRFHSEVFTASMNDIMFFLMLFFLIISTISSPNAIKMLLPKATTQVIVKPDINVKIDENGQYFVENAKTTIEQLPAQVEAASKKSSAPTMKIYADKSVQFDYVVQVMNMANKYRMKVVVATRKETE